jgi:hypothetical protein
VKKTILFSFLSLYLIAFTEFGQILKIGVMIDHYREHKSLNDNTTFLRFLAEHYVYGDGIDSDNDKDEKLPFISQNAINVSTVILESNSALNLLSISKTIRLTFPKKESFESAYLSSIWQPPRLS